MYNSIKYIQECLDSIYRQSLKDVEIICIDDGSIDGTIDYVIQENINKDVIILKQEHKGPGVARNYGLSIASGEYISFLDSDDFYCNNDALEKMYEYGVSNNSNVIGSYYFKSFTDGVSRYSKIYVTELLKEERNNYKWLYFRDYQENRRYWTYIFKRDFLIKHRLFFPNYLRYQDPPFLLRVLNLENNILFVNTCLLCNRVRKKRLKLSEKQVSDLLCGMRDVIAMSIEYKYEQLLHNTIGYINVNYIDDIVCYPTEDNIKKLIDIEGLIFKNIGNICLIPLQRIREKM